MTWIAPRGHFAKLLGVQKTLVESCLTIVNHLKVEGFSVADFADVFHGNDQTQLQYGHTVKHGCFGLVVLNHDGFREV